MVITASTRPSEAAAKQIVKDLKQALNTSVCLTITYWNHQSSGEENKYSIYEYNINKYSTFDKWQDLIIYYFSIMENS
jgi:hypothetical protein